MIKGILNFLRGKDPAPPRPRNIHELAEENQTALGGYEFHATLAPTTALKYLTRHGEVRRVIPTEEVSVISPHFVWIPRVSEKYSFLSEGRTMSSSMGPVPADGGAFLLFLKDFRKIIEQSREPHLTEMEFIKQRVGLLLAMHDPKQYLRKLCGGDTEWVFKFVISELGTYSHRGLMIGHIKELHQKGYGSIFDMIHAPDEILLKLKGIGRKKLEIIRANINQK